MTTQQILELEKCISLLNNCREHLDNLMYRGAKLNDSDYSKMRRIYDKICSALDEC